MHESWHITVIDSSIQTEHVQNSNKPQEGSCPAKVYICIADRVIHKLIISNSSRFPKDIICSVGFQAIPSIFQSKVTAGAQETNTLEQEEKNSQLDQDIYKTTKSKPQTHQ